MLFVEASQGSRGEWSFEHCINISLHLKHLDLVLKCLIYSKWGMYMTILKIKHINLCTVSVVAVLFDNQNLLIKEKNKNYYLLKGVLWGRVIYLEISSWWDLYVLESVPAGVRCRVLSSARGTNTRYLGSLIWRPHRSKLDSAVDFVWFAGTLCVIHFSLLHQRTSLDHIDRVRLVAASRSSVGGVIRLLPLFTSWYELVIWVSCGRRTSDSR